MAKNYFDRYVWLIELINRHGYIKYEDISRAWAFSPLNSAGSASIQQSELPPRTFYNHIEAIFDTFHIEIKCNRDKGYYIANSEDLGADGVRSWLLQSLSVNNMLNETKDMRERILFEKIPSSQKWLPVIVNAMRDGGRKLGKILVKFCASETTCLICHVSSLSKSLRHKHPPTTILLSSFDIFLLDQLVKQFLNCSDADACDFSHFCQSQGRQGLHGIQDLRVVWSAE